jgi:hypothetical protein
MWICHLQVYLADEFDAKEIDEKFAAGAIVPWSKR